MKKTLSFILASLMCVSLVACGGDKAPTDGTTTPEAGTEQTQAPAEKSYDELKAEFAAKTADDLIAECFADKANPTEAEFVKLYANYAFIDQKDDYEFGDNTVKEAVKLLKDSGAKVTPATHPTVIEALIGSEYTNARAYAYREQSANNIDKDTKIYAPLLEKALKETEPAAVYAVLRGLPQTYGNNDDFWLFAIANATSADANVRKAVAMAYSRIATENRDAATDAVIKLMADSNTEVKQNALRYAGCTGNDKVLESYRAILMDEAQKSFHGNAFLGLTELWYGYPSHKNTSEAGYRLAMEYLSQETTSPDIPTWSGMTSFKLKGAQKSYDAWRATATYFDEREVVTIMLGIVSDAEASKNVKSSAIDMIAAWGTLEDAQAAKAAVEAFPDDYKDKSTLITKCDSAITKLNK